MASKFRQEHSFDERKEESSRVLEKYSNRVPVILDVYKNQIELSKCKYLIPVNMTAAEFMFSLREKIKLSPEHALYMFIKKNLVTGHNTMGETYNEYKDADGFLYCTLAREATFG